ncbi:hypothetical protein [Pleomorphomonas sp. PLEO]|uniref:hypothetical protein n=1 Tax=Pleomorphomonas sp. PLEO TaxID=3239306 RepID=UPI00351E1699
MTKSNIAVAQHYPTGPNDEILACDWCDDAGLIVLVRKQDTSVAIVSSERTIPIPDEWREHVFDLVAFSSERLIVSPIEEMRGEQCKVGIFEGGCWSISAIGIPLYIASNDKYLAVSYSEVRVSYKDDGTLLSDMCSIYDARTMTRLSGVGSQVRKANYEGSLMEVEVCCFNDQHELYFILYDTPHIWSYDVIGDSVKFDPMPVAPSYVCAVTAKEKGVHLIVKDQGSLRVYSKQHGQTEWTDRPLPNSDVLGVMEMSKATLLGKPGGKLLAYTEKIAVVLDIRQFQV